MSKDQLILPRADSSCGKAFYTNRRMADGHRVALELWNRATGSVRDGYQLTVHRCNRCGGFHISHAGLRIRFGDQLLCGKPCRLPTNFAKLDERVRDDIDNSGRKQQA